jgi:hypothetical protein
MRNTLLFVTIFCSVLFAAGETRAQCSCMPQYVNITARSEFNLAYAVFVGKVIDIKKSPKDKEGNYIQTVTFQVTKAWKNDLNSNLIVTNKVDGCITTFEKDEEWFVYLYQRKDGSFETYCCCSRIKILAKAGEDVKTFAADPPAKILAGSAP